MPEENESAASESLSRPFWSGTITFGLVSVPVNLMAATRSDRVPMRMVTADGTPLNRRYFSNDGKRELGWDEIVRGYEIEKDEYVIVDDDELDRLAPEKSRDIDLRVFVKASEIDPIHFERPYYLTPAGGSTKAYRLLAQVMEEGDRAGIATFVMRAKEYLIAIVAENGILRAETLRFADEIRSPEAIGLPEPKKPAAAQVKKLETEIEKLKATKMSEKELVDESGERLLALARKKAEAGEDVHRIKEEEGGGGEGREIIDLMQLLQRSLQGKVDAEPTPKRAEASRASKAETPAKKARYAGGQASKRPRSPGGTKGSKGGSSPAAKPKSASQKGASLDSRTKSELIERARELDIPGRSGMSKEELIEAIRESA